MRSDTVCVYVGFPAIATLTAGDQLLLHTFVCSIRGFCPETMEDNYRKTRQHKQSSPLLCWFPSSQCWTRSVHRKHRDTLGIYVQDEQLDLH
ncbi:hypothetical protein EXN66_Car003840 [Channa argus]|uniref:Uncharacterized protein n=1 Tax=Channa argus TaxID=215402 RepID=A0A6G1PDS4_CHAAH|nr:hypothetical protein EXN66_Car003840 [Channa argus]